MYVGNLDTASLAVDFDACVTRMPSMEEGGLTDGYDDVTASAALVEADELQRRYKTCKDFLTDLGRALRFQDGHS